MVSVIELESAGYKSNTLSSVLSLLPHKTVIDTSFCRSDFVGQDIFFRADVMDHQLGQLVCMQLTYF